MSKNSMNLTTKRNAEQAPYEVGRRPSPRFALIIGIDDYNNCTKLNGAVADAKAMKQFLQDKHQMPEDHIVTLYNGEATRDAMIKAFQALPKDERIEKGDPIVIFYAGHGSELPAPRAWYLKGATQCLISQDFDKDAKIMPIPDRTIGVLIEDIAKAKGDNITVIFDCCHSASGTRDPDEEYVPRTVELDITIEDNLDRPIWGIRAGKFPGEFAFHGLRSHILFAACGETERAYERGGRGQFTSALLAVLEDSALDYVTYTDVLERVHLEKQSPHCEGLNRYRALFDTKVPAGRLVWHPVRGGNKKYVIDAGLSHGISRGIELTLYNERRLRLSKVLVDDTSSVDDFETTITSSITDVRFAKVTRVGKVPLYLGDCSILEEILEGLDEENTVAANFRVVKDIEEAKLQVGMEGDKIVFKILDQHLKSLGLTDLPYKATPGSLVQVLGAAAHYFWYLDLENNNSRLGSQNVAVNFCFVNKIYDDFGTPLFVEGNSGYMRSDPTSSNSEMIDFVVDPSGRYGMKIENKIPRDLYLSVVLFNNSSLSAVPWYLPSVSSGTLDAPLKKDGTVTIGYGPGGTAPLSFELEKDQDVDVSYLKVFFSTRPIDLADIDQMSPFLDTHPPADRDRRTGSLNGPSTHARDIWFNVMIPIVQRQGKDAV